MDTEKDKLEKNMDTKALFSLLKSAGDFEEVNNSFINNPATSECLNELLIKYGVTIAQVIVRANISKSFAYQLFSGKREASRDILLRIALAMHFTLQDTQRMLAISQKGQLYPKVRRDAAIIFCIEKRCDLHETCDLLDEIGELPLI